MPVRGIIVPLLHQLIILTGTDEMNTSPVLVDEPKWISIEEQKLRNEWEVISPSGRVEMIVPEYNREGINISKKHQRPTQDNPQGGIIEKENSINISNIMYLHKDKPTRIGFKILDDGRKVRIAKKTGDIID